MHTQNSVQTPFGSWPEVWRPQAVSAARLPSTLAGGCECKGNILSRLQAIEHREPSFVQAVAQIFVGQKHIGQTTTGMRVRLVSACTSWQLAPLVQCLEQGLVASQVRQLALGDRYILAPDIWLEVTLADLSEQPAQAVV